MSMFLQSLLLSPSMVIGQERPLHALDFTNYAREAREQASLCGPCHRAKSMPRQGSGSSGGSSSAGSLTL